MQKHGREDLCKRGFEERLLRSHSSLFEEVSLKKKKNSQKSVYFSCSLYRNKNNLCSSTGYGVYVEKLALNYSLKLLIDTERGENVLLE